MNGNRIWIICGPPVLTVGQLHCWFFLTEITIGKLEGYGVEVTCDYRDRGDNLPLEFLNFCGYRPLRGNFHVDPIIRWWQTLLDEIPVDKDPLAEIPRLPPAQREPSKDSL